MAICPRLPWRQYHHFKVTVGTRGTCASSTTALSRRWSHVQAQAMLLLYWHYRLLRAHYPPQWKGSSNIHFQRYTRFKRDAQLDWTPMFSWSMLRIPSIYSELWSYCLPTQQKVQKNQLQTSDDLTDKKGLPVKTLQEWLVSPPILSLPQTKGRYIVDTDACYKQVTAVLLQKNSWLDRQKHLDICQHRSHEPKVSAIQQRGNDSPLYWYYCFYALFWKEVEVPSVRTTPPFHGF